MHNLVTYVATLKDVVENQILRKQRELQLQKRRAEYNWQKQNDWGLPSSIDGGYDNLPHDEQFESVKHIDFTVTATANKAKLRLRAALTSIEDLHDYKKVSSVLDEPDVQLYDLARWTSDVEFGRQVLNGVNPVIVKKCTGLPSNFPVTNEMVKGFLNRGLTLQQEIEVRLVM